jgi:hypothetical protein
MVFEDMTVQNLQTKIKRQARKLKSEISDEEVPAVLKLELLSDKVTASGTGLLKVAGRTCIEVLERGHEFFMLILMESGNFDCLSRRTELIAAGSDHEKTQYCGRFDLSAGSLFIEVMVIIII